jgi:hypothetical protein
VPSPEHLRLAGDSIAYPAIPEDLRIVNEPLIDAELFKERLLNLCVRGRSAVLPRRQWDRQVLLKSAVLTLDRSVAYTERQLGHALKLWLAELGGAFSEIDHVALRRLLVDDGYLARDPAGSSYRVSVSAWDTLFAPGVDQIDVVAVLNGELREIARRKREHRERAAICG